MMCELLTPIRGQVLVPGGNDQPVDIAQKLRSGKGDVALDRPALVARVVKVCVAANPSSGAPTCAGWPVPAAGRSRIGRGG